MFAESEMRYLNSQRLARLATVSEALQPDVAPVGYRFDGRHFFITGLRLEKTLKYKNIVAGCDKVSLVVDDLETTDPWKPRGIKVHGLAEIIEEDGHQVIRITPTTHWHWGISGDSYTINRVNW